MGGIIGKFFHEFGVTIVAAVLISMFVSFTLDPMLSSHLARPGDRGARQAQGQSRLLRPHHRPRDRLVRPRAPKRMAEAYQGILRWSLAHKLATVGLAIGIFVTSIFMVPLLGTEFVPKADFSETTLNFYTPVGSSLEVTEAKARQVEAIVREFPEVRYTLSTINTGEPRRARSTRSIYVRWSTARTASRSVDQMSGVLRERLKQVPGITVTHVGLLDAVGGNKQVEFSLQGPDLKELERLTHAGDREDPRRPGPGRPGLQRQARQAGDRRRRAARRRLRPGPVASRQIAGVAAHAGGRPDRGQLARARRPDLRRERAARARRAQRAAGPGAPALRHRHQRRRQRAHRAAEPGGAGAAKAPAPTRSTAAT